MAAGLADILNGDAVPAEVAERALVSRYQAGRDPGGRWTVTADRQPPEGRFGPLKATAMCGPLARRLADLLNEVDPAPLRRGRRGFGWW